MSDVAYSIEDPLPPPSAEVIPIFPEQHSPVVVPEDVVAVRGLFALLRDKADSLRAAWHEASQVSPEMGQTQRRVIARKDSLR